jgi:hypothetical protein
MMLLGVTASPWIVFWNGSDLVYLWPASEEYMLGGDPLGTIQSSRLGLRYGGPTFHFDSKFNYGPYRVGLCLEHAFNTTNPT